MNSQGNNVVAIPMELIPWVVFFALFFLVLCAVFVTRVVQSDQSSRKSESNSNASARDRRRSGERRASPPRYGERRARNSARTGSSIYPSRASRNVSKYGHSRN